MSEFKAIDFTFLAMLGVSLRDRIRNEEIRRADGRWGKKILEWRPRMPASWTDDLIKIAGSLWMQVASDRSRWKSIRPMFSSGQQRAEIMMLLMIKRVKLYS